MMRQCPRQQDFTSNVRSGEPPPGSPGNPPGEPLRPPTPQEPIRPPTPPEPLRPPTPAEPARPPMPGEPMWPPPTDYGAELPGRMVANDVSGGDGVVPPAVRNEGPPGVRSY